MDSQSQWNVREEVAAICCKKASNTITQKMFFLQLPHYAFSCFDGLPHLFVHGLQEESKDGAAPM